MANNYKKNKARIALAKQAKTQKAGHKLVNGGGVPGGHNVPWDGIRAPFITPMTECNSIPLRHSDVVVDIGAYCGTYAIRCARFPVKKVIAYEPTPHTFEILSLTDLPNMQVFNEAIVGDDTPSVDLFISKGIGVTNSLIPTKNSAGAVTIKATNYVHAVAEASVVKIDVEGAEYSYPIIQPQLRAVILDFHKVKGNWQKKANEIIQDLRAAGFKDVITPDWSNGWTQAGSWIREIETSGEFEPMMQGHLCCGCAVPISSIKKALCPSCHDLWAPKHREGYRKAELRHVN